MSQYRSGHKGGKLLPALCNIMGILILGGIILTYIPITVPKLLGYELYHVVSGSMEPEIAVGSVVYVKIVNPKQVVCGDVIAFFSEDSVIVHRAVKNQTVEGKLTTKGDANAKEDMQAVPYADFIGTVVFHLPFIGRMMSVYTSQIGKMYVICLAACGAMLNMLAARMRTNQQREWKKWEAEIRQMDKGR